MAKQMTDAVKLATSPYQYALSTRAGASASGATYFGQFQLWPGLCSTLANSYFGQFYFGQFWANKKIAKKKKTKKTTLKQKSEKNHRENNTIRDGTNNIVRFLCENVAGHGLCPPFGFSTSLHVERRRCSTRSVEGQKAGI